MSLPLSAIAGIVLYMLLQLLASFLAFAPPPPPPEPAMVNVISFTPVGMVHVELLVNVFCFST